MTNALALSSIALTLVSLLTTSIFAYGLGRVELAISVASIGVTLFEVVNRARGGGGAPSPPERPAFQFPWATGLAGGFVGGAIAAPIIIFAYYAVIDTSWATMAELGFPAPNEPKLLTEIAIASLAIGAVVGMFALGLSALFEHVRRSATFLTPLINRLTGAVFGGVLAGFICGPLGTLYFGLQPLPVLEPGVMLMGALPAAGLMTFSIVTYDNERLGRGTFVNLALAMAAVALVAVVVAVTVTVFSQEITELIYRHIVTGSPQQLLTGGIYYGAFVGAALGAVVGIALLLTTPQQRPGIRQGVR